MSATVHRVAAWFHRHPRARLAALLAAPLAWLVIAYLGALGVLLVSSLWSVNTFTGDIVYEATLDNFRAIGTDPVYGTVVLRSVLVAAAVTLIDGMLAVPIAFFMAKVVAVRYRRWLLVAIVTPLWASYLVKAYAWRVMLANDGPLDRLFGGPGYGLTATVLVLSYMWLPYMILPVYAALERIPHSYIEASRDLGAKGGRTLRSVILPLALPGLVAGSIFTFSLTLGDYITPLLVGGGGGTQFIGNVVYDSVNGAGDLPFAAAFATVPLVVMGLYLLIARRLGAFEAL